MAIFAGARPLRVTALAAAVFSPLAPCAADPVTLELVLAADGLR